MKNHIKAVTQLYSSKLQSLLNCLEHVSKRGDNYRARCPAHGGRSRSTLSITELDDGRILLHCFHGCEPQEVLDACGLVFADVMPERLNHKATPEQRRKWRQDAIHRDWTECLRDVLYECRIIYVAGLQLLKGEPLNQEDRERLNLAMKRIECVGRMFNGIA